MPKEWYDWRSAVMIEDEDKRKLYLSILADKKPYFMRYIYPDLMRRYNRYIKNASSKARYVFGKTIEEIENQPDSERTIHEQEFLFHFYKRIPVGIGDCVINRICKKIELEFDGHLKAHRKKAKFDYTIMKSGAEYTMAQFNSIKKMLTEYNRRVQAYTMFAQRERVDDDEANVMYEILHDEFVRACENVCSNSETLCDIMLDACYRSSSTKRFVWDICGKQIISNLAKRNNQKIHYPIPDTDGDVSFDGRRFRFDVIDIGGTENDCA